MRGDRAELDNKPRRLGYYRTYDPKLHAAVLRTVPPMYLGALPGGVAFASPDPDYYLLFRPNGYSHTPSIQYTVYSLAQHTFVMALPTMTELRTVTEFATEPQPRRVVDPITADKRMRLFPQSRTIVTFPPSNDRLMIRPFDWTQALAQATNVEAHLALSQPKQIDPQTTQIALPSELTDVAIGGCGRYMLLRFPQILRLGVFDLRQARVVKWIELASADSNVTAGPEKFYIFDRPSTIVERWNLATLKRDLAVPIDVDVRNRVVLTHPLEGTGPLHLGHSIALSTRTLQKIEFRDPLDQVPSRSDIHAQQLRFKLVSMDKRWLYTDEGLFKTDGQRLAPQLLDKTICLPAPGGNLFVALSYERGGTRAQVYCHEPLQRLLDLPLPEFGRSLPTAMKRFDMDRRILFSPADGRLVTLAPQNDRLIIRRFDTQGELVDLGQDYLFFQSVPPHLVRRGQVYAYKLDVQSNRGELKYTLQGGPPGMTLSANGELRWSVPPDFAQDNAAVALAVTDASGRTQYQGFDIAVW